MWKEEQQPIPVQLITGYDPRVGHVLIIFVGDLRLPILISSNN